MGNLLDNVKESRGIVNIKSALNEIGVDCDCINSLDDVADAIKGCCQDSKPIVNATITSGNGIKVTPIDRKEYKISANSEATLTQDISKHIKKGTSIQKALHEIVHHNIPDAMNKAIQAPVIIGIEVFKAECDGIDYYDNKAFGKEGKGRKTGLRPFNWYMKVYVAGQCEPIYVDLGVFVYGIKNEFLTAAAHQTEQIIEDIRSGKKPNIPPKHPCCKPSWDDIFGDSDTDLDDDDCSICGGEKELEEYISNLNTL